MRCHRSSLPTSGGPGRQRGVALVIAMLVFAMATVLVVAMASDFQRFFQRSSNVLFAEQAYAYLRGAEELAALALARDFEADQQRQSPRDDKASKSKARVCSPSNRTTLSSCGIYWSSFSGSKLA